MMATVIAIPMEIDNRDQTLIAFFVNKFEIIKADISTQKYTVDPILYNILNELNVAIETYYKTTPAVEHKKGNILIKYSKYFEFFLVF